MSTVFFRQQNLRPVALGRLVKIMFLTSLRDIALCDRNGEMVETREGPRYMKGVVEHTVEQTRPGGALYRMVEVVGVVTDDTAKDLRGYPAVPQPGRPWIHSLGLCGPDCRPVAARTWNVPSDFRLMPRTNLEGRAQSKLLFESEVLELMAERQADILVSDHYMARIDHLHRWLPGRVLNIHPAVTLAGHPYCFRGQTPTADAIARAGREAGVRTGATLHFVDAEIDNGPVIAYSAGTPVFADDEPQQLRYRNYQAAKLPVFISGLVHYLSALYPHLCRLDLSQLAPVPG